MDKEVKQKVADKAYKQKWHILSILLFCIGSFLIGFSVNIPDMNLLLIGIVVILIGIFVNWGVIRDIKSSLDMLVNAINGEGDSDIDILDDEYDEDDDN